MSAAVATEFVSGFDVHNFNRMRILLRFAIDMGQTGTSDGEELVSEASGKSLRPRDYFWRPWYAKLWWGGAAIFWVVVWLVSWLLPRLFVPEDGGFGFLLAMIFHPYTIVPVLGLPLLFAWRQHVVFPWDDILTGQEDEEPSEGLYDGEGIGFHRPILRSHVHDPTDVRSPLNPVNPASAWWRDRH